MRVVKSDTRIERYRFTAQAIGLMELLGNERPSSKQVRIVEQIIRKLQLPWEACSNTGELIRVLKYGPP